MDNMIPVLNTSPNPLVVYMGNPPKPGDQCDAFTEKRMHALNHDGNLLYVELAADKDADPDDREQWAKANPSYPKRTSEQAIMRMRNNLSEDSFRREALGIWDETATAYAISPDLWQAAAIDDVPDGGTVSFGIDMPPDRSVLTIGAALRYADGSAVIQMANIKDARQAGTMWAVDWLAEHWPKTASVVIDAQSPAMSLLPELKKAHVRVTVTNMQEMGRACGRFPRHAQGRNAQASTGRIPARSWPQPSRAPPRGLLDSPARSPGTNSAAMSTSRRSCPPLSPCMGRSRRNDIREDDRR